jgi:hypothetical protein
MCHRSSSISHPAGTSPPCLLGKLLYQWLQVARAGMQWQQPCDEEGLQENQHLKQIKKKKRSS